MIHTVLCSMTKYKHKVLGWITYIIYVISAVALVGTDNISLNYLIYRTAGSSYYLQYIYSYLWKEGGVRVIENHFLNKSDWKSLNQPFYILRKNLMVVSIFLADIFRINCFLENKPIFNNLTFIIDEKSTQRNRWCNSFPSDLRNQMSLTQNNKIWRAVIYSNIRNV